MTPEELIAELQAIATTTNGPDGYATMEELIVAGMKKGKSEGAVKKWWKVAKRAGRLTTKRVERPNVEGNMQRVPAYRILPG